MTTPQPKKISELSLLTSVADEDFLLVVDDSDTSSSASGTTKRTTFLSLKNAIKGELDLLEWNTAYSWGDHSQEGYLKSIDNEQLGALEDVNLSVAPTDGQVLRWYAGEMVWKASDEQEILTPEIDLSTISVFVNPPGNSDLDFNSTTGVFTYTPPDLSGILDDFNETDPVYSASPAANITNANISNWNTAHGWGNHASVGYLRSTSPAANVTSLKIANWDTAFSWGNHAAEGYLVDITSKSINELSDVNTSNFTPSNGQALIWSSSEGVWRPGNVASGVGGSSSISINDLTDVDTFNTPPLNEQVLTWDSVTSNWRPAPVPDALASRTTVSTTTASITNNNSASVTVAMSKSYLLLKIQTSHAAWVTVYSDVDSRNADSTRTEFTDPLPGTGVIAEVITTGASTQIITPATMGWNNDSTVSSNAYLKIVNKSGATNAITVTLTFVALEA